MVPASKSVEDFARNVGRECGNTAENPAGDRRLAAALDGPIKFPSLLVTMTDDQRRKIKLLATAAVAGGHIPYWEALFLAIDKMMGDAAYAGVQDGHKTMRDVIEKHAEIAYNGAKP